MEFDIEKGRFSFRLTAPYSEDAGEPPVKRRKPPRAISHEVWYNFFEKGFGFDVVFAAKTVVYREARKGGGEMIDDEKNHRPVF